MTRPGHAYARGNAPHDGDDAVEEREDRGMRIVGQGTQEVVGKIAAARIDRMAQRWSMGKAEIVEHKMVQQVDAMKGPVGFEMAGDCCEKAERTL